MPLFEFKCKSCNRKFTMLIGVISDSTAPSCPSCGSSNLSKLVSRFSAGHSEEDLLENLADPSKLGDLEDPGSMRKFVKEMGKELGEEMGDDLEEYLEGGEGAADEPGDTIY